MGAVAEFVSLSGVLTGSALAIAVVLALLLRRNRIALRRARSETASFRSLAEDRASRISTLSHEIRTPLAIIIGSGELLLDLQETDATAQKFIRRMVENSGHLNHMAEQLLAEARLDAQLFELRMHRVELRSFMRSQIAQLRKLHARDIALDNHGSPVVIDADSQLLAQVVSNLVSNAVKHAGTEAKVKVRVTSGDGQSVVSVSDDGRGMTQAERQRLFTPFISTDPRGYGLGMVITQKIVALHGGKLLIDTVSRHGTTMYVTLPDQGPTREGA